KNVAPGPAIAVGIHWCPRSARAFYSALTLACFSWQGQLSIGATDTGNFWETASTATLRHGPQTIITMVKLTAVGYNASATRVFVAGHSRDGMMGLVTISTYPELFKRVFLSPGFPIVACLAPGIILE
ncbi:hypothetical protein C7212DRAFT_167750, partial [Tuber magnatum]